MDLYLIRHADAVPHGSPGFADDGERPLTPLGQDQAARLGALFARLDVHIDVIVTSSLVRARETAFLMLPEMLEPAPRLVEYDEIGFAMRRKRVAKYLELLALPIIAVVGHQPTLSAFLAWLIGGKNSGIEMEKAGMAKLEVEEWKKGGAALRWLATPEWI